MQTSVKSCRECGKGGLRWGTIEGKFRLFQGTKLHSCLTERVSVPSMSTAIKDAAWYPPVVGEKRMPDSNIITMRVMKNRQRLEGVLLYNYSLEHGLLEELGIEK